MQCNQTKMRPRWWRVFSMACLLAANLAPVESALAKDDANARDAKAVVLDFQEQFFNRHDVTAADRFLSDDYRQHNPNFADGRAPFVSFFSRFFAEHPNARATTVRMAADGDLVFAHIHFQSDPEDRGRAIVNIYRVRDGKICEHWDVVQPVPATAQNGNSMF